MKRILYFLLIMNLYLLAAGPVFTPSSERLAVGDSASITPVLDTSSFSRIHLGFYESGDMPDPIEEVVLDIKTDNGLYADKDILILYEIHSGKPWELYLKANYKNSDIPWNASCEGPDGKSVVVTGHDNEYDEVMIRSSDKQHDSDAIELHIETVDLSNLFGTSRLEEYLTLSFKVKE